MITGIEGAGAPHGTSYDSGGQQITCGLAQDYMTAKVSKLSSGDAAASCYRARSAWHQSCCGYSCEPPPVCECEDTWTDPEFGGTCAETQQGCPATSCSAILPTGPTTDDATGPTTCDSVCGASTCGALKDLLQCSELEASGCDCAGCCVENEPPATQEIKGVQCAREDVVVVNDYGSFMIGSALTPPGPWCTAQTEDDLCYTESVPQRTGELEYYCSDDVGPGSCARCDVKPACLKKCGASTCGALKGKLRCSELEGISGCDCTGCCEEIETKRPEPWCKLKVTPCTPGAAGDPRENGTSGVAIAAEYDYDQDPESQNNWMYCTKVQDLPAKEFKIIVTAEGTVADFDKDGFETGMRTLLACEMPLCEVAVAVTAASVKVEATVTDANKGGGGAVAKADTLQGITPAELSELSAALGVTLLSAPTVTAPIDIVATVAFAPPPPLPPPSPPPPSPPPVLAIADKDELKIAVTLYMQTAEEATATYGPIAGWDVSAITDMAELFYDLDQFNADISSWDTSKVTTMAYMFDYAEAFNQPLSFDTSKVTTMYGMFSNTVVFNQPLSFDTSKVTTMGYMFS